MTKKTHTPLPWEQDGNLICHIDTCFVVCEMTYDENYEPISNGTFQWDKAMANAAFIVKAVNAHDELLAACNVALSRLDHNCRDCGIPCDGSHPMCGGCVPEVALRSAIKKAEGNP